MTVLQRYSPSKMCEVQLIGYNVLLYLKGREIPLPLSPAYMHAFIIHAIVEKRSIQFNNIDEH